MEKEFVPYELALRLKALGFNEPCFSHYTYPEGKFSNELSFNDYKNTALKTSAPTFRQAFSWFRENHNFYPIIQPYFPNKSLTWNILLMDNYNEIIDDSIEYEEIEIIGEYEEAELACLEKLLEIVEQDKTI